MTQVKIATEQDQLTDIESLYVNAIELLKHLREPGILRHVETRREYQLKATKLDYRYIELKPTEGFYIEFHKDHKYEIKSKQLDYAFVGRFNHNNQADIKILYKWAHIDDWQLETTAIDTIFALSIPKGTKIYVGNVGFQNNLYVGGTQQIFIPTPWNIKGIKIIEATSIKCVKKT